MQYTDINSAAIDQWVDAGWEWGIPIDHDTFLQARQGKWSVLLTPTKPVPRAWFPELHGLRILGLASGGGQQMPVFTAAGAVCTVLDYSRRQLDREREVAAREGYSINCIRADMTKPLPFPDESFDLIFHPVSNCYIADVRPVWQECFRILRKGGRLLCGLDNSIAYAFDENGKPENRLPYNPMENPQIYSKSLEEDGSVQFSHSIEEQIGGQLDAGFTLRGIYEDTNACGVFSKFNIPLYYATCAVK